MSSYLKQVGAADEVGEADFVVVVFDALDADLLAAALLLLAEAWLRLKLRLAADLALLAEALLTDADLDAAFLLDVASRADRERERDELFLASDLAFDAEARKVDNNLGSEFCADVSRLAS